METMAAGMCPGWIGATAARAGIRALPQACAAPDLCKLAQQDPGKQRQIGRAIMLRADLSRMVAWPLVRLYRLHATAPCASEERSEMFSWLRRWRETAERIDAEADVLIGEHRRWRTPMPKRVEGNMSPAMTRSRCGGTRLLWRLGANPASSSASIRQPGWR